MARTEMNTDYRVIFTMHVDMINMADETHARTEAVHFFLLDLVERFFPPQLLASDPRLALVRHQVVAEFSKSISSVQVLRKG
jgi:hypothetical protein